MANVLDNNAYTLVCSLTQPGDCPPAKTMRHHRRSCDRVWPPALEVRLARLSLDDGPDVGSSNTHIIPLPPPLTYSTSMKQSPSEQVGQQRWDDWDDSGESRLEPIQEVVGTAEGGVKVGRGGGGGGGGKARERAIMASAPVSPAERRRNSILGPLSPSVSFQMERHLQQQHTHPPHIDVKYLKGCKSLSHYSPNNHDSRVDLGMYTSEEDDDDKGEADVKGNVLYSI